MTTVLLVVAVLVAVLLLFVLIELRKGGGSGRTDDPNAVSAVIASMGERLTAIQEGVGAMKRLAEDFRGFEALIRDVNSRGAWGEVQLRQILEEVLAHGQWEENVETIPGTGKRVEFAIKFPGMNDQELVWMPVDSKFPLADYQRVLEAQKDGDADKAEEARKALEKAIIKAAKDIREKYVASPHTTEFGVLFLPTEGLYLEALRRTKVNDELARLRIVLAGPTTFSALLNAFRMGFQTMAIEKRSSEVWQLLSEVKTQFGKLTKKLKSLKKQLDAAKNTVAGPDSIEFRIQTILKALEEVEQLPYDDSQRLVDLTDIDDDDADADADADADDDDDDDDEAN